MSCPCTSNDQNEGKLKSNKDCKENVVAFKCLDPEAQCLIKLAVESREQSYSPYSNFKVGASVLCDDGTVYAGCNCENSSFTVGTCAERCAYFKALSDGKRKFKAVAVVGDMDPFITPCGACRQFMSEFGNINIYLTKPNASEILCLELKQLLPFQFDSYNNTSSTEGKRKPSEEKRTSIASNDSKKSSPG